LPEEYVKQKIAEFYLEDVPAGDITTKLTVGEDEIITADIQAEEDIIFVGEQVLPHFFDESFQFELFFEDGDYVKNGEIIGTIKGKTSSILTLERTMLNLLQRLCGIANNVRQYADLASPFRIKILDSRKTVPGLRLFDKYAVAAAGGFNHRLNLSSGILIKDNHIANKDLRQTLLDVKTNNKSNLPIELEVDTFEQLKIGLEVGVDGFLLDNFTPEEVHNAMQLIRSLPGGNLIFVEASGGINLSNIQPYLSTGIDAISIGAITHSVKAANIHLEFR
jgi:nicotinate-nucleotide pyrophosphorylase (carboxylating)